MVKRWSLLPNNGFFTVYVHKWLRTSPYPLHTHGFYWAVSIVLSGKRYGKDMFRKILVRNRWEEANPNKPGEWIKYASKLSEPYYSSNCIKVYRPNLAHRIIVDSDKTIWRLFAAFGKNDRWGYYLDKPTNDKSNMYQFLKHSEFFEELP